ncbi:sugar ABC transporter substrate-binding protein [Actinomadura chibensis]|uniref:Sugar ABC transporter substrate-binding protein n=1 Tax=Actinomadura chibensis TaxID=392828 RepID=A0A5D0NMS7_9ACTN|nr:sugar ABC transporter substrate-binding protein [Actinomadura chibensis]
MAAVAVALVATASACAGAGGAAGSSGGKSINVLMVGNPQMADVQKLTAGNFTKQTGIKVNFTVLPENELRDKVTQDVATGAGQYDVVTVGAYEVPIWAKNGWLHETSGYAGKDAAFDQADLLKPMVESVSGADGKMYGVPFYGESSFLMYRKDLFAKAGLTMPEHPTWQQVAGFAAKLDDKSTGTAGICLRGLPGWGELFAPLTTVVNTFGGTWFTKDWRAQVNAPDFAKAVGFYVDLVRRHGEPGAAQAGFTECLNTFGQGKAAMWYDATSAAASLEDAKTSKVAGKVGYAYAPVERTKSSGWLWTWAWAMPKTTKKADESWKFMSWASGKEYERLVGAELGWSRLPDGKRESTYEIPEYQRAAKSFYKVTLSSIVQADPVNPGVQPRPTVGIQFVGIPEFADLGTKVSQSVSAAIAGRTSVDQALSAGQKLADQVAAKYR